MMPLRFAIPLALSACLFLTTEAMALPTVEPIQAFERGPRMPEGGLTLGPDGNFYGPAYAWDNSEYGRIFRVTPGGEVTTIANFNGSNGSVPRSALLLGSDGNLYGTTGTGGANARGTVFRMATSGVITKLADIPLEAGSSPFGLAEGDDGNFYGVTCYGGGNNGGSAFRVSPAGVFTKLGDLQSTVTGTGCFSGLTKGPDGNFYGHTTLGGSGYGRVFRLTPSGTLSGIVNLPFNVAAPDSPSTPILFGADGNMYFAVETRGYIFRVTPQGTLTSLVGPGGVITGRLAKDASGNIYGTTTSGRVFRIASGAVQTIAIMDAASSEWEALSGVTFGADGDLYSLTRTEFGVKTKGGGAVFRTTLAGQIAKLAELDPYWTGGACPMRELSFAEDGNLYGTTSLGGAENNGTIFRVTPVGQLTRMTDLLAATGIKTYGPPVSGGDGYLYGTTYAGGSSGEGGVYRLPLGSAPATMENVRSFSGQAGSLDPVPALIPAGPGVFLGVTQRGNTHGTIGLGTIFAISSTGQTLQTINSPSRTPYNPLTPGPDGWFYGAANSTSSDRWGSIFRVNLSGQLESVCDMHYSQTSGGQTSRPAFGRDGNLYVTCNRAGTNYTGAVFRATLPTPETPNGTLSKIADLGTIAFDASHLSALELGPDGDFYGVIMSGGLHSDGLLYRLTHQGVLTKIADFKRDVNGHWPYGRLIRGPGGHLYGTTESGGVMADGKFGGGGQIYRLRFSITANTLALTDIGGTRATLKGEVNPLEQNTTASFHYGTDPTLATYQTISAGTVQAAAGTVPVNAGITGLLPYTTYYYRAAAMNEDHPEGRAGEIRSFTTGGPLTIAVHDGPTNAAPRITNGQSAEIGFGTTGLRQPLLHEFSFTNTSDAAVSLQNISASPGFTMVDPLASPVVVPAGGTHAFTIRFEAAAIGNTTGAVTLTTNADDDAVFTIPVAGNGPAAMAAPLAGFQRNSADGTIGLSFTPQVQKAHQIEYSDDLRIWKKGPLLESPPTGFSLQWTDSGPPHTMIHPANVPKRFYRLQRAVD